MESLDDKTPTRNMEDILGVHCSQRVSNFTQSFHRRASYRQSKLDLNNPSRDNLEIFLGGSCNPTTWRQNIAIPYLESQNITYYNPQVDDWTPDMVTLESMAKKDAKILFFVIDRQTRSTVGLVESAFIAGSEKNLVLVMFPFDWMFSSLKSDSSFKSTTTSKRKTSHMSYCQSTSSRKQSSSSSSSHITTCHREETSKISSTAGTSIVNKDELGASTIESISNLSRIVSQSMSVSSGDEQKFTSSLRHDYDISNIVKINGEEVSFQELFELQQARRLLRDLVTLRKIPIFSDINHALRCVKECILKGLSPDQFFDQKDLDMQLTLGSACLSHAPIRVSDTCVTKFCKDLDPSSTDVDLNDVFLSVDSGDLALLDSNILPLLQEEGLTYSYNSAMIDNKHIVDSLTNGDLDKISLLPDILNEIFRLDSNKEINLGSLPLQSSISEQFALMKDSKVLLFIITNRCRGLSVMVLASHCMSICKSNIVLCIQYLEEPCTIRGENLTKSAVADYNRGRLYLCDHAEKSQVPVFNSITEAIKCCQKLCRPIQ